jgi:hypothetical protein
MASNSPVPPERQDALQEKPTPTALLGPELNGQSGQQLSSFTELKQGTKSRTLFAITDSPLKVD